MSRLQGTVNREYVPLSEAVRDVALVPGVRNGGPGLAVCGEVSFGLELLSVGAVDIWVEVEMPVRRKHVRFPEMDRIGVVIPDIRDDDGVFR